MAFPYLSAILFLPLAGAIVIVLFLRNDKTIKMTAAIFTGAALVLALTVFFLFDRTNTAPQFVERYRWIPNLDVHYFLGVDGLSLPMVVLTALLGFLAVPISWRITLRPKEYFAWLLALETGVLGVFTSLDFVLFFLFWEVELIPMYLLIATWGSAPPLGRREYSAMKFLIYTISGSAFMLLGILALYFTVEPHTFDMVSLGQAHLRATIIPLNIIFFLIFIAYAIKLPLFPFHTWLPDAHTDAPTAVSVMLAGVLLKMGGYAMLRISVTIMPEVAREFAGLFAVVAVINVLYGALVTMRQQDIKRMIAYSSVSHMGYVMLGIAAFNQVGLSGASLQMFSHGIITGLLFMMAGLTYDKVHTRQIPEMGGLAQRMPVAAVAFTIASLAALGLPGLVGFIAELTVFLGAFPVWTALTILAIFGIVLTAGYMLWMMQRAYFGPLNPKHEHAEDAHGIERLPIFVAIAVIVLLGVYPSILTDIVGLGVLPIVARLGG